ncbi:hypothetical protein AAMO2058_000831300 [Amorphochlora amoebiformis]|uniref:Glycerophosphocholine acyltransferase 1 n=1 Tax=Amorphochlora amoebiformis TaxID=1561963 RepID=A0A7S0H671_9EUKA|mmetsp:Transcript_7113/g.11035  ORF Transcript_7113/g.11035 Transcript_7113/m.11035 type:complete len:221 (+) Transcript_7113:64-726(+)
MPVHGSLALSLFLLGSMTSCTPSTRFASQKTNSLHRISLTQRPLRLLTERPHSERHALPPAHIRSPIAGSWRNAHHTSRRMVTRQLVVKSDNKTAEMAEEEADDSSEEEDEEDGEEANWLDVIKDELGIEEEKPYIAIFTFLLGWTLAAGFHFALTRDSPVYFLVYFVYNPIKWLFKLAYAWRMGLPRPDFFDAADSDLFLQHKLDPSIPRIHYEPLMGY